MTNHRKEVTLRYISDDFKMRDAQEALDMSRVGATYAMLQEMKNIIKESKIKV